MNIRICYDNIKFRLRESKKIEKLIEKVIKEEKKNFDDLIYIFTGDNELLKINREFLKSDYYTDVIAFDFSDKTSRKGEVYISIDTVKINAINYNVSLKEEILRVMIHATLHLCGYKDNTKRLKRIMSVKENKWINSFYNNINGFEI